jgi:hypothetical protein
MPMMKQGRPPIPKEKRKGVVVRFRVSKAEFQKLTSEAKRRGVPVSRFVRMKLFEKEKA